MHTKKIIGSLAVLLALIIGAGIYSTMTLRSTAKKLEVHVSQVEDAAAKGDWDKAKNVLSAADKDWDRTKGTWTVLLDHFEIDNIDTTMSRLTSFVEAKSTPLALGESAVLKQYIKHIPDNEIINLRNIF